MLSDQAWNIHILARRPWMVDYLHIIKSTVNHPDFVCLDVDFHDRECFYALGRIEDSPDEYFKVVIQYDDDGDGEVVTAYPTEAPKAGEARIWP